MKKFKVGDVVKLKGSVKIMILGLGLINARISLGNSEGHTEFMLPLYWLRPAAKKRKK